MERSARRGLIDWPAAERFAEGRLRHAPGALTAAQLRATEPLYARDDGPDRAPPERGARHRAAGRRGQVRRGGSGRLGPGQLGELRRAHRSPRGDLLDQILPPGGGIGQASIALANRWIATRQIGFMLGFMGARVLGQYDLALLSAETTPGRLLFVEENIRQTASTPGGPARRLPDVDRAPRDDPRLRVRGPSLAAAVSRGPSRTPAGSLHGRDQGPRPGDGSTSRPGAPRRGQRRALDGAPDERRATAPVPRDPGGDEPAGGVQRLHHGRGRPGPGPRRGADQRALPCPPRAAPIGLRAGDHAASPGWT